MLVRRVIRMRVREINEAFRVLGALIWDHSHKRVRTPSDMSNSQPLTKLMVLHEAADLISMLEQRVRGNHADDHHCLFLAISLQVEFWLFRFSNFSFSCLLKFLVSLLLMRLN